MRSFDYHMVNKLLPCIRVKEASITRAEFYAKGEKITNVLMQHPNGQVIIDDFLGETALRTIAYESGTSALYGIHFKISGCSKYNVCRIFHHENEGEGTYSSLFYLLNEGGAQLVDEQSSILPLHLKNVFESMTGLMLSC